ncbi:unnamed protein product [Paramecium primaurelia]|uniref:EF-hand domain-containing protein n=1 Tax=Paramecium primaurelia TaxID=5886 RepID=A0A8S1KLB8_PARPR|nr:unnamed protein product [Paramecium primaurelia]
MKKTHKRQSTIYRQSIAMSEFSQKLLEKNDVLAQEIQKIVKKLSPQCRIEKAERHIYDAYYLRAIRNDIDLVNKTYLKQLWYLENNQYWLNGLFLLSIIYQLLTFFEPSFVDQDDQDHPNLFIIELIILLFMGIDSCITIVLLLTKKEGRFTFNPKKQFKLIAYYFCLVDFIIHSYEPTLFRVSKICRTLLMPMYSKDLRRNLKGIFKAGKDLFLLIILYLIIISIFSFIGINLIGKLDNVDLRTQDYGDFFKLFSMLFMVATLDFYPDILIPPMLQGIYYCLFFITYLLLFIFLFAPIPLAVVYEGFRKHRMEIAISDIIKQKTAMMASFISLDFQDQGFLTRDQFRTFILHFYKNSITESQINQLFNQIDQDFNDKVQFDEFHKFLHLLQDASVFSLPETKPLHCWEQFRNYLISKGLLTFVEGNIFGISMLIITISNCVLIVVAFFIEDQDILDIFNLLDTIFLILYSLECSIKIIALGIKPYFEEGWNIFDITLVILQIIFDYILFNIVSGNIVQSIKANRLLRLAKIQKVFRLFRAFRSLKIINILFEGLQFLDVVRTLLYKIIICVPLILRLMLPVQMVFFIYSCVGMYLYGKIQRNEDNPYANSQCDINNFEYSWGSCKYADFSTFAGSYLMMLQMFIAAEWNQIVFELTYDTDDMVSAMLFVGSFEFFSIFLLALIGGLVWEVFTVVSQSLKQEEDRLSQLENNLDQQQENNNNNQAATHDKKKKLILNDDNPDEIRFHRKFRSDKISKTHTKLNNIQPGFEDDIVNDERPELNISQPNSRNYFLYHGGSGRRVVPFQSSKFNIQRNDVIDHFLKNFITADMWLQKKQIEGLDINKVAIDYMIHLRSEIKKDEMFQKKNFNISNHHLLIQNAVLRDASEVYIKQQEDKFFKTSFGQKFERIQELKFQSKFKIESKIIFSLMGILKFPNPNLKYYFQILNLIENYFTYQLLSDYSFFKLIHQINNKWYTISIEEGQIYFFKVGNGPWDYTEQLFSESNIRICENLSSLLESGNQECLRAIEQFSISVKSIAKNFEISLPSIDINNSCILYQIKNEKLIVNDIQSLKIKKSNVTSDDQSPNNQQYVYLDSQNQLNGFLKLNQSPKIETSNLDEQKNVNQTILFVIARTTAQEQRIKYQNITMLIQFIQDLGSVIQNYSSTFFKQINNLYELRYQDKIKSMRKL